MSDFDVQADERARHLMMAALDGELAASDHKELERLLEGDPALAAEWRQLQRVKEVTKTMSMRQPSQEVWEGYWMGVYRRLERGLAWILVSLGAIVVLSWAAWEGLQELWKDQDLPTVVKGGSLALIAGLVILVVSVVREKLVIRQTDPYKDVVR
jgi:ferric-dicitrate binding protein FerR (iron transport regulator)